MSSPEKTYSRREEILQLAPGAADLAGLRKGAANLDWPREASQLRESLRMAYGRLACAFKSGEPFDPESLNVTSLQKIVQALGTKTGWDRYYETPGAALAAQPQTTAQENSPLTRLQRIVRRVNAEFKDDQLELRLIEHVSPHRIYRWADTTLPVMLLDLLSLTHVSEQLERAAMLTNAMFCSTLQPDDYFWEFIGSANAYFFKLHEEGWRLFAHGFGLDPKVMIERNHRGATLSGYGQKICDIAPSDDEFKSILTHFGHSVEKLATAESVAEGWRQQFLPMLKESNRR